jgi:hypothetical protein
MRRGGVALGVFIVLLLTASFASAQESPPGLGDRLFSLGGLVTIDPQPTTAALPSELWLVAPEERFIANNERPGDPEQENVEIGPYPVGSELIFEIRVDSQGNFRTGPGSRNPDGIPHALVTPVGNDSFRVSFEDLYGGGDRNYNDNVFNFTGVAAAIPPVAEDQTVSTFEDEPVDITLTATDQDSEDLAFAIDDGPAYGTLTGTAPSVSYTPSTGYSGPDQFTFTATDPEGNSDTGTVSITVVRVPRASVGDASVIEGQTVEVPITFDAPLPSAAMLTYQLDDGSATSPEDYTDDAGTLSLPEGAEGATIAVQSASDVVLEQPETLTVRLTDASGRLRVGDGEGTVTIVNLGRFTCTASAIELPLIAAPVVANAGNLPCAHGDRELLDLSRILPLQSVTADVLSASTDFSDAGDEAAAHTELTNVGVNLLGLNLSLDAVETSATARCNGETLEYSGSVDIANLVVNGVAVNADAEVQLPLLIGTLYVNRVIVEGDEVVAQAVFLDLPGSGLDLVIGESRAGVVGDPCVVP